MIDVQRTFTVSRPQAGVVGYLADFAHAVDWDPGTQECTPSAPGPVAEGSQWRNVSVFRGRRTELTYRLERREADRLVFVGRNKTATSTDDLTFAATAEGTEITYHATVRFHGLARLAGPILRREFERLGDELSRTMPEAIHKAVAP